MDDKYLLVEDDYDNVEESFHNEYDSAREFKKQINSFINKLKPGDQLLNIGGTFAECKYFIEKKLDVTDIDISQAMLDYINQHEPRVKIIKANVKDYQSSFKAIWACRSLIHIPPEDIELVLKRIYENLEKGGLFGAVLFVAEGSDIVIDEKPEPHTNKQDTTYYCVLYPPEILKAKIVKAGFTIQISEICIDQDGDKAIYFEATK